MKVGPSLVLPTCLLPSQPMNWATAWSSLFLLLFVERKNEQTKDVPALDEANRNNRGHAFMSLFRGLNCAYARSSPLTRRHALAVLDFRTTLLSFLDMRLNVTVDFSSFELNISIDRYLLDESLASISYFKNHSIGRFYCPPRQARRARPSFRSRYCCS
ncbi:hypothetical protein FA10DRAFT_39650 [Acaromyces ingoldii]|uniref:Uncharacterized protein n=1 Tax=Acaromyces ingoldii TaxID=215250 RepID=A0A316YXP4_9BASI|nr:hypothetical protein FA10DRAFT_39650 [Acaromyces ingoldii]PWN94029.1 hypothetical protein FA10DRAFT_39650 [Acaromyces ingoldii]